MTTAIQTAFSATQNRAYAVNTRARARSRSSCLATRMPRTSGRYAESVPPGRVSAYCPPHPSLRGDAMKRSVLAALCSAAMSAALVPGLATSALAALGEGSLDTSFSSDGKLTTPTTDPAGAKGVAVQPDGKIVVAGFTSNPSTGRVLFLRYTRSGALDSTFSGDGVANPVVGA